MEAKAASKFDETPHTVAAPYIAPAQCIGSLTARPSPICSSATLATTAETERVAFLTATNDTNSQKEEALRRADRAAARARVLARAAKMAARHKADKAVLEEALRRADTAAAKARVLARVATRDVAKHVPLIVWTSPLAL